MNEFSSTNSVKCVFKRVLGFGVLPKRLPSLTIFFIVSGSTTFGRSFSDFLTDLTSVRVKVSESAGTAAPWLDLLTTSGVSF